jgi:zinc protease
MARPGLVVRTLGEPHSGRVRWSLRSLLAWLGVALAALLPMSAAGQMAANVVRSNVAGVDVIAYRTGVEQIVTLRGSLPAGDFFSPPENPAIATLVAGMLDKGTTSQGKFELAEKLERVGATITFGAGSYDLTFSARCLKEDLPLVIGLLAEQMRAPAFAADEFGKYQRQLIGSLRRQLEDTNSRASVAFSRAVYPAGHPNRAATSEELIAGVEAATIEDLRAFHAARYGPARMTLVAVGDIEPAQLQAEVQRAFAGWSGGGGPLPPAVPAGSAGVDAPREQTVMVPGKTSVSLVWGTATGLKYRDPDALALRVGTAIFGSGFTGRLMANVRDKEGLTYGIGALVINDTFSDGDWRISATFSPTLLGRGVESTRRQLLQWHQQGVTAGELASRKSEMIGSYQVSLATTTGLATALMSTVQRGLPLSWLDEYPARINALSLEQVNGAIKKYLHPDRMVLIQAGTLP